MKRLNATHRKLLATLTPGTVDSLVSIAQISGIQFGVVLATMPLLVNQGYVRKTDKGYTVTTKGRTYAEASAEIRGRRLTRRKP